MLVVAPSRADGFRCVVLGSAGGLDEGDLSAYLVAAAGSDNYVCLDAGTLSSGLRIARARGSLGGRTEAALLGGGIKAYLLSHPHLDHVAGLILASTDNAAAPVIGLGRTLDVLRDDLFNWRVWPNFTNEGNRPLGKYTLTRVEPATMFSVPNTGLRFEAWPLSHGKDYLSTAFLVFNGEDCLAYLGDTGPDAVEGGGRLLALWKRLVPLVRRHRLRAIFMEASYPDEVPDDRLFGHLTPKWMARELHRLRQLAGPLDGLTVVVTHIKPSLRSDRNMRDEIAKQIVGDGVRFVIPVQGQRLDL